MRVAGFSSLFLGVLMGLAVSCGETTEVSENNGCVPSCQGRVCGADGCGGTCGTCEGGDFCQYGLCVSSGDPDVWGDTVYVPPDIQDPEADSDGDGIKDGEDNCPFTANPSQINSDDDEGGDACDIDDDNDGVADDNDCDPKNPLINADADEVCDGVDNNCNGETDEGSVGCIPMYLDSDGDRFGVKGTEICTCAGAAADRVVKFGDCNDSDASVNPGANEICDNVDNDCDGEIDEGCDEDGDGWCNEDMDIVGTPTICPNGGGDCHDGTPAAYPGALEDSGDGVDNDCDGTVDEPIECPGTCTGQTVDAYLCALEMCFGSPTVTNPHFYSPTGDSISSAWAAVAHYGNVTNDLAPQAGASYGLLGTGPVLGTSHSEDLSGGSWTSDPYLNDGWDTYDNVEFIVTLKAPAQAIGFSIDYVFFSEEYEEFIGSSYNDKFYILLKAPVTTGNQTKIVNYTDCSDPNDYHDFVDPQTGKKQCYIAINTAYSEPCPNAPTNIAGTGFQCGAATDAYGSSTGWLVTRWPIEPNETFQLTFHIHDTSDGIYDSAVILDNFHWMTSPFTPGTASHN